VAAGFGKDSVHTPNPEANTVQFLDMDEQLVADALITRG
jgi:hypothetical protein